LLLHLGLSVEGVLIVIEGIDGAGKTTVAREITRMLVSRGYRAIYTYEPYESPFAEALVRVKEKSIDNPLIDALAMACDRAYHVEVVVKPAMERGEVVVMDRYYYSTIAYQGAMGVDTEWLRIINNAFPKPDLAIYLDIEPEEGLKRIRTTGRWGFYEKKGLLEAARRIYLELVRRGELVLIDARRPLELVVSDTWRYVENLLRSLAQG